MKPYFDRNEGAVYRTCPECKGTGMACDDDYCEENCWHCMGCGTLKDCIDDLCDPEVGVEWCA